jgi:hypothetical protein
MADENHKEWVLPASIPFAELKGKDLEECLYWLMDAMGAKDLEWRTGGTGGGAADGGRDLEAHFYTPAAADDNIDPQVWWIECKGRTGTVDANEVKNAVVNAQATDKLDCIVIATNTQFSNPTIDWVKEWQKKYPRPVVRLWDGAHLERLLSRHPEVVLRLFSQALSLQGRFQAMESRFWNKIEFVTERTLSDLWKNRDDIEVSAMGIFAATVNEFANGAITRRPWGAILDARSLLEVLQIGLVNVSYLLMRGSKAGVDQTPMTRAFAYLILCAIDVLPAENVARLIDDSIYRGKKDEMPEHVREFLLMPIADQLLSEMQDICSSDCRRLMALDRQTVTEDKDEVESYWLRLESTKVEDETEEAPKRHLRLERLDAPCIVGFPVDKDNGCPLFALQPTTNNVEELLAIIKRVAAFRKGQAAQKRAAAIAKR